MSINIAQSYQETWQTEMDKVTLAGHPAHRVSINIEHRHNYLSTLILNGF